MESSTWAVSAPKDAPGVLALALQRLRAADLPAASCADAGEALADGGRVLLAVPAGAAALARAQTALVALRREAPQALLLAAVDAGDARAEDAVASLLEAGASDAFALGAGVEEWRARLVGPPRPAAGVPQVRGFLYASPACAAVAERLPLLADCDANVLIVGETGTGKEVCAQAIHYLSPRARRPWVAVNCGAIPAELIEAELFGHVKGAYTTAHVSRSGLVREAEGGTLFLDDVDCLPLSAQAKLLRFLQEHEYRALGANTVQHADVRVVAASNCNLFELSRRDRFRQDLYFRLNVLNLALPALRARVEDISLLALHFVRHYAREFHRPARSLSTAAIERLMAHDWPGNVRELQHAIERAVLLTRSPLLRAQDIDLDLAAPAQSQSQPAARGRGAASFREAKQRVVEDFERRYIEGLLAEHDGNITTAARCAKKDRRAFFALIRKHRIEPGRFRPHA